LGDDRIHIQERQAQVLERSVMQLRANAPQILLVDGRHAGGCPLHALIKFPVLLQELAQAGDLCAQLTPLRLDDAVHPTHKPRQEQVNQQHRKAHNQPAHPLSVLDLALQVV